MNYFKTIYQKDYIPKRLEELKSINDWNKKRRKEYADPVSESFKYYLRIKPSTKKGCENVDEYYDKAKLKYTFVERWMENKPVDKKVVNRKKIMSRNRTQYQVDYCDLDKELAYKEHLEKTAVHLPDNIYIPLTTQRGGHRPPASINPKCYEKEIVQRPKNNLDPNYKVRKILNVTTGDTEYTGIISKLGERIMIEELHGPIFYV